MPPRSSTVNSTWQVQRYTDNQIVKGIKDHDHYILKYLYTSLFPKVIHFVLNNNGSKEEAKDLFQETIIILYRRISGNELQIEKSFTSYFMVMIKLLWFKKLERNPQHSDNKEVLENIVDDTEELFFKHQEARKYNLFQKHFRKLREDCKQILTLFLQKVPLKTIAEKIGSKSENYVKKRKHKCKNFLIDSIKADPDYNKVFD